MGLIPELRAVRLLLVHVNVVEALGRHVALVLDERIIGTAQVGESRAARRPHALGLGLGDSVQRSAQDAAAARVGVAADERRASAFAGPV